MADPGNLRDSVVSIWHRNQATDEFLGSSAFIAPNLVLTARHVIKDKGPKDIYLRLVLGHDCFTPKALHPHETLDIAVIDLGREIPRQDVARLDWQRSGLEGTTVDLYGINPDSHNRDECRGYTLGNWHNNTRTYLFDHAQRLGFSGGIVALDGVVVGIMTRRHKKEQQGVMLPLAEVADWLQVMLPAAIFAPPHIPVSVPAELTQHEFARDVRQQVGKLLERQSLRPLRTHLLAHAASDERGDKPENVLIPLDETFAIESSIHVLRQATRACRQQLAEQGANADAVQAMMAGALDVFGWLVLLTVSENWVERKLEARERAGGDAGRGADQRQTVHRHFQDLLGATYLVLPVETEVGTQVVESRLREQPADFELDDKDFEVWSPSCVRLGDLELGIAPEDKLSEIKKLIWVTVFKGVEVPVPFRPFHEAELKDTLEIRYQDGESYYVMLPARRGGATAGQETLFQLLHRDLPHLGAFLIGLETGEQVLVMNETRLRSLTREFLRALQPSVRLFS